MVSSAVIHSGIFSERMTYVPPSRDSVFFFHSKTKTKLSITFEQWVNGCNLLSPFPTS